MEYRQARSVIRVIRDRQILAGIVLVAMSALACTSSGELGKIQSQLSEIHFELLELRKQGPTKAEVQSMEAELTSEIGQLLESQAETDRQLAALTESIRQLESEIGDTNFRLTQLAQLIEATNLELQAVRSAAESARVVHPPPRPWPP